MSSSPCSVADCSATCSPAFSKEQNSKDQAFDLLTGLPHKRLLSENGNASVRLSHESSVLLLVLQPQLSGSVPTLQLKAPLPRACLRPFCRTGPKITPRSIHFDETGNEWGFISAQHREDEARRAARPSSPRAAPTRRRLRAGRDQASAAARPLAEAGGWLTGGRLVQ